MSKTSIFDHIFNRTVMLRPTSEGVLEPVDITGQDAIFLNQRDLDGNAQAVQMKPTRVYRIRGKLGNAKNICIHLYNTTQLMDLYQEHQDPALSETMLADLLDIEYQRGIREGRGGSGTVNEGVAKYLKMILIFAAAAAIIGVLSYLQGK